MSDLEFSIQDIKVKIKPIRYADGSWGFELRYWLFRPTVATTYYQFHETFPTKAKMLDFAKRAAAKHFRQNRVRILRRLASLA